MSANSDKLDSMKSTALTCLLWVIAIACWALVANELSKSTAFAGFRALPFVVLAGLSAVAYYLMRSYKNAWPLAIIIATIGAVLVLSVVAMCQ